MEKLGYIEIHIVGSKGKLQLKPELYDIKEIALMLKNVDNLLFPTNKKERPLISYSIEKGSIKNIFRTSIQAVIGFSAILSQIQKSNSIDFLELKTAQAIENIQNVSYQKNYNFLIKTSTDEKTKLEITPSTKYLISENIWVETELYLYGILTNAGGKSKANIHIDTEEYGTLIIDTKRVFLKEQENNLLYKKFGVRAIGKQNIDTGEIDPKSLELLELKDYNPSFDYDYLKGLIKKAKTHWANIEPDNWISELRGNYDK